MGRLDPRPDLAADSPLWERILQEAKARSVNLGDGHTLHELFLFLRCVGVTVQLRQGQRGPYLRLIWEPACAPEQDEDGHWQRWIDPETFRATYLEPYRQAIAAHLRDIAASLVREQRALPLAAPSPAATGRAPAGERVVR